MTQAELEQMLKALKEVRKEYASSPEKARAYLIQKGLINEDGSVKELPSSPQQVLAL